MDRNEVNESAKEFSDAKSGLRQRIVAIATDAFTKNGIRSVTMDEIASEVGISKRTLYETFEDKEELLVECVRNKEEENCMLGAKVVAESNNVLEVILHFYKVNIAFFHKANKQFFEDLNRYPKVGKLIRKNQAEHSDYVVAFFNKGVEQGIFRKDVNFEITNVLVREQVNFLIQTDLCRRFPFVEVYESIVFNFLRGVSTPKGQKILEDFVVEYRVKDNI